MILKTAHIFSSIVRNTASPAGWLFPRPFSFKSTQLQSSFDTERPPDDVRGPGNLAASSSALFLKMDESGTTLMFAMRCP